MPFNQNRKRSQRTRAAARSTVLPESEWNFGSVPSDELEACYYYEYARQFYGVSNTLQKLRAASEACRSWQHGVRNVKPRPQLPKEHELGLLADYYAACILSARVEIDVRLDFRTFPIMTWQELRLKGGPNDWPAKHALWSAESNQQRRNYPADRLHIETLAQLEPPSIRTLPAWIDYHGWFRRDQDLTNTDYGFFAINWNFSLSEIEASFKKWLNAMGKQKGAKPNRRVNSRGGYRDKLNRLGALRMQKHYPKRELLEYGESRLKINASYSNYPDLVEAAKKAEHEMMKLFPSDREAAQLLESPISDSRHILTLEDIPDSVRS